LPSGGVGEAEDAEYRQNQNRGKDSSHDVEYIGSVRQGTRCETSS
jgi:hypothetical protein